MQQIHAINLYKKIDKGFHDSTYITMSLAVLEYSLSSSFSRICLLVCETEYKPSDYLMSKTPSPSLFMYEYIHWA